MNTKTGYPMTTRRIKESSMKPANPHIQTNHNGSSSIQYALIEANHTFGRMLEDGMERMGLPKATLLVKGLKQTDNFSQLLIPPDPTVAVDALMEWIEERSNCDTLTAIGNRRVKFSKSQQITEEIVGDGYHGLSNKSLMEELNRLAGKEMTQCRIAVCVIRTEEEWIIANTFCHGFGFTIKTNNDPMNR